MSSKRQLSFWLEGHSYSRLIRDMWKSGEIKNVFELLGVGHQMTVDDALDFIFGKWEFIGDTRKTGELSITDDYNFSKEELEYIGTIPPVGYLINKLEDEYISNDFNIRLHQYKNKMSELDLRHHVDYKTNLDNLIQKQKKVMQNLSLLYPMVNRDSNDFPIDKQIPILSDEDNHQIEIFLETKKRVTDKTIANLILESDSIYRSESERKIIYNTISQLSDTIQSVSAVKESTDTKESTDNKKIKRSKTIIYNNGYISPDGIFYPCEFNHHYDLSKFFSNKKNAELDLEKRGWIKLSNDKFYMDDLKVPTMKQKNLISEYMERMEYKRISFNYASLTQKRLMEFN
jgi:hypothetical protein